jgi:hypothetical protein
VKQRKIIELQARREYEGAGEYPSFIGWDRQHFAEELTEAENVLGMSVWCQTGGWHRFRRVRIPPLLHVYWDSLFINHGVRKVMRHFVGDPDKALQSGEQAALLFPRMITLAQQAALPTDDIEHMRDFFNLLQLARRYYFLPFSEEISAEITAAKKAYKQRWPRDSRARYRVKISFVPFHIKHRSLAFAARVLLRRKRGYRLIDRLFILYLSSLAYRALRPRNPAAIPKFLRKSAMGVDILFK